MNIKDLSKFNSLWFKKFIFEFQKVIKRFLKKFTFLYETFLIFFKLIKYLMYQPLYISTLLEIN